MNLEILHHALDNLTLGAPIPHGRLHIYPLIAAQYGEPDYKTLVQAIDARLCRMEEIPGRAQVNRLLFVNLSDRPILLLDGDILIGAMQNRVLHSSLLAPPHATLELDVYCVEQGRWGYTRGNDFTGYDSLAYARLRAAKAAARQPDGAAPRTVDHQYAVWEEIRLKSQRMAARSRTESVAALYERHAADLKAIEAHVQALAHQVGAIFMLDGKLLGMDLFDAPATFSAVLPRLLRGYGIELYDPQSPGQASTHDWPEAGLDALRQANTSPLSTPGLGSAWQLDGQHVQASCLQYAGRIVHLFAYPVTPVGKAQPQ